MAAKKERSRRFHGDGSVALQKSMTFGVVSKAMWRADT